MDQLGRNSSWLESAKESNVMLELIQSKDWSKTPLGKREDWPRSLKVALDIILHSAYPMFIWWGRELIMFHNDAYLPVLGQKHPDALGRRAREVWSEIWSDIGEIVENVFRGEEFYAQDLLLYLGRKGFMEETYWTFSYSPFLDDKGEIGGLFCACNEETEKILGQRRLSCIKDISALSAKYKDLASLNKATIEVLKKNPQDIPFSALYLLEEETLTYKLQAHSEEDRIGNIFPAAFSPGSDTNKKSQIIREIQKTKQLILTHDFEHQLKIDSSKTYEGVKAVAVTPLLKPGQQQITGLLIGGLSPYLEFENTYKNFLTLTAAQISTAIADIRLLEEERRQGEALRESEKTFRELADHVPVIIWVTDSTGHCTYLNQQWYDYSGQEHSMASGFGWLEKVHPDDAPSAKEIFLKANQEQTPFSLYYRLRDRKGDYFWHVDTGKPRFDQAGHFVGFTGVVFDVHEAKLGEEQLQEKEEKLRLAAEATNLGTWDYYPLQNLLQWSDTCKEIFGIPVREEMTYEKFLQALHEDDRERTTLRVRAALEGTEHYDIEYRVIRKTDGEERWIRATGQSYFNEKNEAFRFIGTAQDITDRKLAEEQKNDFLRIAGHELRTPLTSIVGYLGLLQRMNHDQEPAKGFLDKCLQSTLKMRSLISDFLDISSVERGELSFIMENIDFSDLVEETLESLKAIESRHTWEVQVEPNLFIYGDKARLEQVILNLINNAQKYSQNGQTIQVVLTSGRGKAFFRIRDEGIGMESKEMEKIFRKFYRVPSESKIKGIGLGLFIAKKIIDYHNGDIRVQSVPGKGTQFTVELPLI